MDPELEALRAKLAAKVAASPGLAMPSDESMRAYLDREKASGGAASQPPSGGPFSNIPGQLGGGVSDLGSMIAHPVETAKGIGRYAASIPSNFMNALFTPTIGTSPATAGARGGMRQGVQVGQQYAPENTPGAITPEQTNRAQLATVGNAMLPAGIPGMITAGAANNPDQPFRAAATAGLAGGLLKGVPAAVRGTSTALKTIPTLQAVRALETKTLPAAGYKAGIQANLTKMGEAPSAVDPMLAEAHPATAKALTDAASQSPALWNVLNQELLKRGRNQTIGAGIRAQTNVDLSPQYEALKKANPSIDLEGSVDGIPANHPNVQVTGTPEARAFLGAYRDGWRPSSPDAVIPNTGTGGLSISKYLTQPTVRDLFAKASNEKLIGDVPQAPNSFATLLNLKKRLDAAIGDALNKRSTNPVKSEIGHDLIPVRDNVDAFLAQQVPDYAPIRNEWARRMSVADYADERGGQLELPSPPSVTGHMPMMLGRPANIAERASMFPLLDQWRAARAGSLGGMLTARVSGTPLTINDVLRGLKGPMPPGQPPAPPQAPPPSAGPTAPAAPPMMPLQPSSGLPFSVINQAADRVQTLTKQMQEIAGTKFPGELNPKDRARYMAAYNEREAIMSRFRKSEPVPQ